MLQVLTNTGGRRKADEELMGEIKRHVLKIFLIQKTQLYDSFHDKNKSP